MRESVEEGKGKERSGEKGAVVPLPFGEEGESDRDRECLPRERMEVEGDEVGWGGRWNWPIGLACLPQVSAFLFIIFVFLFFVEEENEEKKGISEVLKCGINFY